MIVLHTHVDNAFSEIKILIHLMKAVIDTDFIIFIENSFNMGPRYLTIDNVTEDH